jgi:hypothetical protein
MKRNTFLKSFLAISISGFIFACNRAVSSSSKMSLKQVVYKIRKRYVYKSNKKVVSFEPDDIDGRGPEHISIPDNPAPGVYTLYAHYYDNHGIPSTKGFVSVRTSTNQWDSNPLELINSHKIDNNGYYTGDAYAICSIKFPSGKITPIQQKVVTSRSSVNMPKKERFPLMKELSPFNK